MKSLVADAYDLAEEAGSDGFLEHEGGDVGAGDGAASFGEVAGEDADSACRWVVEQARRADDGPGEVGLGHLGFAVAAVDRDVVEEGVGHEVDCESTVPKEEGS